ncbi:hypothetical protein ACVIIV_006730 [Bradyrhizobium sp. USDA 4354]
MVDSKVQPVTSSAAETTGPDAVQPSCAAIPGLDLLGSGFNPFDVNASEFAPSSLRGSLVTFMGAGGTDFMTSAVPYQDDVGGIWPIPPGSGDPLAGTAYQVPADVHVGGIFRATSSAQTFSTYQQIADYYSVQAGLEGGDGLFWASANSAFSSQNCESSSYFYGIQETLSERWSLTLDNALLYAQSNTNGSSWDAVFSEVAKGLPATFDPTDKSSVDRYQNFFTKYGTHIVASVFVGARSSLSVAIERSSNISQTDASLDISAEYDLVTGSLGMKSSYKNSNYESSRKSKFLAIGGNETLASLASNAPSAQSNTDAKLTNYEAWIASTGANPATIAITLVGMWELCVFPGTVKTALKQAYAYFSLPNSVLPFYSYVGSNSADYLYTTLENPEGAPTEIKFSSYKLVGTPFYILPQTTSCQTAVTLHRYYNKSVHFFTTDAASDAAVIAEGRYAEDLSYFSKVLPLQPQGLQSNALATVYRWALRGGGHCFGLDSDAPPVPANEIEAAEGEKWTAFAKGPSDPFSLSESV